MRPLFLAVLLSGCIPFDDLSRDFDASIGEDPADLAVVLEDGGPPADAAPPGDGAAPDLTTSDPGDLAGPRYVFVTSSAYSGDFLSGDATGGDALCQGQKGTLGGTFRALIATASGVASSRFTPAGRTIVLPSGKVVSTDETLFTTGIAATAPMGINETSAGFVVPDNEYVWTGFNQQGGTVSMHCNSWTTKLTGDVGGVGRTGSSPNPYWANLGGQGCEAPARLYCIQQ